MTAGILDRLGVNFGEDLLPGTRANPLGYFEDRSLMDLNRKIVKEAGGTLHDPPPRARILEQEEAFQEAIRDQVRPREVAVWGWKDPAASLTIELFAAHLANPYIVVCRRAATPVAESWGKMMETSLAEGIELWKEYNERIDAFLARYPDFPVLEIHYEAITRRPEQWIDTLIDFLDLQVTKQQRTQAIHYILPKREILKLRAKSLLKSGLKRPWEVPAYVMKRMRHTVRRLFAAKE